MSYIKKVLDNPNGTAAPRTGTQSTGFIVPNANIQQPSQQKTVGSGNFTNLQNYLNANKDAGTRIGATVGTKIDQNLGATNSQAENATQQFGTANQGFQNLVNTGNNYLTGFKGPQSNQQIPSVTGTNGVALPPITQGEALAPILRPRVAATQAPKNAWDTGTYTTNVTGQDYANKVGTDESKVKEITGLVSGTSQAEKAAAAEKARTEAANRQAQAQQNVTQHQQGVGSEQGRFGLLKNYLGGKEYRSGLQSLDNAFLQKDTGGAIEKLKTNVQDKSRQLSETERARLVQDALLGKNSTNPDEVTGLYKSGNDVQKNLSGEITRISDEQAKQLDDRVKAINDAKAAEKAAIEADVKNLTGNNDISERLWQTLGFDNLDSLKNPQSLYGSIARGYNTIDDLKSNYMDPTKALLNTQLLDTMAKDRYDVMNQGDINNLSILDKLLGRTKNENYKQSLFGTNQYGKGDVDLVKQINDANAAFGTDASKELIGTGTKDESFGQGFGDTSGRADIDAAAKSSVNRYLRGYGGQTDITDRSYKNGPDNPSGGKDETARSILAAYNQANANLESQIKQRLAESGFGKTLTRAGKQSGTDNTKDMGKNNSAGGPTLRTNAGQAFQDTTYTKAGRRG